MARITTDLHPKPASDTNKGGWIIAIIAIILAMFVTISLDTGFGGMFFGTLGR